MTTNTEKKGRVLVAMSGGVDSAVAAALLVDQGYDVVGITMQVWDYTKNECDITEGNGTCCSSTDVDDARAVADKLNIPFYVMNCEAKFQTHVIDDFVNTYLQGKTPIPCVNCNTFLKFDHLIQKMKELECDYLATGHYAQVVPSLKNEGLAIQTSEDDWKDQTYFLFTLNPQVIPQLLFPVGHLNKDSVRQIAEDRDLIVARKKDSTGICFIGKSGYSQFIESQVGKSQLQPGVLKLYPEGKVLGDHSGIHNFTYGQRKGLGVSYTEPLYVLKIDPSNNDVWLGEESYLYGDRARVKNLSWLGSVEDGEVLKVKIRFAHRGAEAKLRKINDDIELEFLEPQRAITPGQAAVFYRDNQLVGGGWIE
ncbi:MAG: tRNA 2-thiouridine(34) synthase MnmA [Bdellovibrionales bacterium]|nr:tRNA 2-thiouridine(34) synthase MnmA [Bdellovibrionales bacterium]